MPNYKYRVRDRYGKSTTGTINGEDKNSVAKHLNNMGYVPIEIEEIKDVQLGLPKFADLFNKVTQTELNVFTRQLLTLQKAGVSLISSLGIIEKQSKNKYFKDIIKEIAGFVESGSSLSEALSRHPKIFSELYINMVKAGEASGLLEEILERLVEFGEKEVDNANRIRSATRYPMITLGALFAAFVIVVNFVIPKFASVFAQFKGNLPLPTKILLGLSFIMRTYWYIVIIGLGILVYLCRRYVKTTEGRLWWDSVRLKIPVFGNITMMFAMERFARTMSILLRSGLPILQVLDMVSRTVGNAKIARTVNAIANNVREGKSISEPMEISGLFPPMVIQMVAVGEDTGRLDELLMKVSEYYEQQSDYIVKNISTLIEPLFIVILGAMVLVMALAIFLPMWNLISLFK